MHHFSYFEIELSCVLNLLSGTFCLILQALNTLGSTKWRVNKRVLSVVDRIWSSGGRLADLVDREDVRSPFNGSPF